MADRNLLSYIRHNEKFTIASADFGTITCTLGGPRVVQVGMRLTF